MASLAHPSTPHHHLLFYHDSFLSFSLGFLSTLLISYHGFKHLSQLKSYLAQNSPSPAPTCEIPYPRRRSSLYQTSSNHPYSQASSSSFSSASSASSVITLSSSNIQNTLKQQSSWESTSSYYQQQHQQNVYTDHLF
ncbi:hypothetical protein BD408DRAFT_414141 [Parasitella parasitica]|nr:hypothetical protein BD408DRAFT_414141 [Parasitella parasitica]